MKRSVICLRSQDKFGAASTILFALASTAARHWRQGKNGIAAVKAARLN